VSTKASKQRVQLERRAAACRSAQHARAARACAIWREFARARAPAQVLRFFCVWDDRAALYGDRRPYRLHLFPDGSVEILETRDGNSGRDPFPVFLRRGLLPKPVRRHRV